jgi:broad specificity phosphatase PhoE
MPTLVLVRHCESSGPEPDTPRTERGRIQTAGLARFLAPGSVDTWRALPGECF